MKLAWYAKLYIYGVFFAAVSIMYFYILQADTFPFSLQYMILIISVLITGFYSDIQLKYNFKLTSVWYPIVYFTFGKLPLCVVLFFEAFFYEFRANKK